MIYKCLETWKCSKVFWINLKKDYYQIISNTHTSFFERMCEGRIELICNVLVGSSTKTVKGNLTLSQVAYYLQLLEIKWASNHNSLIEAMKVLKIKKLGELK